MYVVVGICVVGCQHHSVAAHNSRGRARETVESTQRGTFRKLQAGTNQVFVLLGDTYNEEDQMW